MMNWWLIDYDDGNDDDSDDDYDYEKIGELVIIKSVTHLHYVNKS